VARACGEGKLGGLGSGLRHEGAAPARPKAGGCRLWLESGAAHVRVPGGDGEREGGREEAGWWASPWDRPHMSVK
jgi:hypothetical protein